MQALVVFRHGQTDHNLGRRFQGMLDTPLNSTGHAQASRTGDLVASCVRSFFRPGDTSLSCVTSDLSRARDTAAAVREALAEQLGLTVWFEETPALREWHCGDLADHTVEEFDAHRPGVLAKFYADFDVDPECTPYPGETGEAKKDVRARIAPLVERWNAGAGWDARANETNDVRWAKAATGVGVVSTHGGIIHLLLEILGCPSPGVGGKVIGNGDVLVVLPSTVRGRWSVFRHYKVGDSIAASVVRSAR